MRKWLWLYDLREGDLREGDLRGRAGVPQTLLILGIIKDWYPGTDQFMGLFFAVGLA